MLIDICQLPYQCMYSTHILLPHTLPLCAIKGYTCHGYTVIPRIRFLSRIQYYLCTYCTICTYTILLQIYVGFSVRFYTQIIYFHLSSYVQLMIAAQSETVAKYIAVNMKDYVLFVRGQHIYEQITTSS